MSSFGTFPGGWVESIIKLISAKAEAEALLGLAELGKCELKVEVKTKKKIEIEEVEDCTSGAVSLVNNKNLLHRKVDPHPKSLSPNPNTEDLSSYQTDSGRPHGPPGQQIRYAFVMHICSIWLAQYIFRCTGKSCWYMRFFELKQISTAWSSHL